MNIRVLLAWLTVAFTAWWIIVYPAKAAGAVRATGHLLDSAARGLSDFLSSVGISGGPLPLWGSALIITGIVLLVILLAWFLFRKNRGE